MSMDASRLLILITSSEPMSWREFLNDLDDVPEKEDRAGWRELFGNLKSLEVMELVEIERGRDGRVETLQLTLLGAERAREALKESR